MTPASTTALAAAAFAAAILAISPGAARAGELEVLHWWTSGGEAKAAAALKATMQQKGHTWKDFAVAGGGGDAAMTVLKSRVVSGNPPAAAQIKGPALQEWAAEDVLVPLDDVAATGHWDTLLPKVVADGMKYHGHYIAAPVNVHRVNWLWINPAALKKAGAKVPTNWDEFFATAEALKKAGLVPVARGGQGWQDFTTFESVVLGQQGAAFYAQALVKLDPAALAGPQMLKSLETFKRVKAYTDRNANGRDWNLATAMVIRGEAGMQLMGDWAKGEIVAAGKVPGQDVLCAPAPGSAAAFTYNIDSFAFFKQKSAANAQAQKDLATAILSPSFQELFNLAKGSIPVRPDVKLDKFDACARASAQDFAAASRAGTLVPSIAHDMAVAPATQGALKDVVSQFWSDDRMTATDAQKRLVAAAKTR